MEAKRGYGIKLERNLYLFIFVIIDLILFINSESLTNMLCITHSQTPDRILPT